MNELNGVQSEPDWLLIICRAVADRGSERTLTPALREERQLEAGSHADVSPALVEDCTPMQPAPAPRAFDQGAGPERLPLPAMEAMDAAQRAAAQALIDGPRKAVYGPFVPLLRVPKLLDPVAQLGQVLRFEGALPAPLRELVPVWLPPPSATSSNG